MYSSTLLMLRRCRVSLRDGWGLRHAASPAALPLTPGAAPRHPVDHSRLDALALAATDGLMGLSAQASLPLLAGTLFVGDILAWSAGAVVLMLALYTGLGLYPGFGLRPAERLRRRWLGGALAFLAVTPAAFIVSGHLALVLIPAGALALVVSPLAEDIVRSGLRQIGLWGQPVHAGGLGATRDALVTMLEQNWQLGFIPVRHDPGVDSPPIRTLVLPRDGETDGALPATFTSVFRAQDVGLLTPVRTTAFAPLTRWIGTTATANPRRIPWRGMKRAVDVSAAILIMLLASPLVLLTAGLIYAVDPGPVFYGQFRRGLHGKPVRIWKLRSMYQDSQRRLERLLAEDLDAAAEWYARFKLSRDPRILPWVGAFIRRYSIDELPQLWNVLRGELSLVGPRVFIDYDLDIYDPADLQLRQSVLPGLTGFWQVSVRSDGDNKDKARYDSAYVRTWSFWLDLDILYRTVGVVLTGRGGV